MARRAPRRATTNRRVFLRRASAAAAVPAVASLPGGLSGTAAATDG
ncbi:hypothetical protein [Streptomyces sp. NPDC102462]